MISIFKHVKYFTIHYYCMSMIYIFKHVFFFGREINYVNDIQYIFKHINFFN